MAFTKIQTIFWQGRLALCIRYQD